MTDHHTENTSHHKIITQLLSWYDQHKRTLPWRYGHHERGNPYHTWLSEVMLQQTVVAAVITYYKAFIKRWPTLKDLASAHQDDVLTQWQGLGYYSRGRNLLKCAQIVQKDHGGHFPQTIKGLLSLPGIGPYTASAIASIAFRIPVIPVDGNVIRVFARLFALTTPLPALKQEITQCAASFPPSDRPGDFAQALMDLGATVCKPTNPKCEECPLTSLCKAYQLKIQSTLPHRLKKQAKPIRYGCSLIVVDHHGHILLEKRPDKGLLGGMMQVPTTVWHTDYDLVEKEFLTLCSNHKVSPVEGIVKHTFTHFHLESRVFVAGAHGFQRKEGQEYVAPNTLKTVALPTIMKKILDHYGTP